MSFGRAVLAAFIGGVLAIVFVLAWRASKETGKSIPASLTDVPTEAQRLAADLRSRAAQVVDTGWETLRGKEAPLKERLAEGVARPSGEPTQPGEAASGSDTGPIGEMVGEF